jgi:antitoxin component YwqK of YwqJK toxin-antitoxin module
MEHLNTNSKIYNIGYDLEDNISYGIGTIYYKNGKKKYEGYFINDLLNNEGIEYYDNGNIKCKGFFKNGLLNGYGVEYYENNNIKYEGYFKNGVLNGYAIEYYDFGNKKYEGYFKNGLLNGDGIEYYIHGDKKYEGNFENGLPHEYCIEYYDKYIYHLNNIDTDSFIKHAIYLSKNKLNNIICYKGTFEKGKYHGYGIIYNDIDEKIINNKRNLNIELGDIDGFYNYIGEFKNGYKNGYGTLFLESTIYKGNFEKNMPNGIGTIYYINGNIYIEGGIYKYGYINDKINVYYKNGYIKYQGETMGKYLDYCCNGYGKLYNIYGNIIYDGEWKNNKYHGTGTKYEENGYIYFSNWKHGEKNGFVICYNEKGHICYKGKWINNNTCHIYELFDKENEEWKENNISYINLSN